jgi:hypothetical protein
MNDETKSLFHKVVSDMLAANEDFERAATLSILAAKGLVIGEATEEQIAEAHAEVLELVIGTLYQELVK